MSMPALLLPTNFSLLCYICGSGYRLFCSSLVLRPDTLKALSVMVMVMVVGSGSVTKVTSQWTDICACAHASPVSFPMFGGIFRPTPAPSFFWCHFLPDRHMCMFYSLPDHWHTHAMPPALPCMHEKNHVPACLLHFAFASYFR